MSATELREIWESRRRHGDSNINCGVLRGIGKTQCLNEIISECPFGIRKLLLCGLNLSQYTLMYPMVDMAIPPNELITNPNRYITAPVTYVYADEVPGAQTIVNSVSRTSLIFVAGFYSTNFSTSVEIQHEREPVSWEDNFNIHEREQERESVQRLNYDYILKHSLIEPVYLRKIKEEPKKQNKIKFMLG